MLDLSSESERKRSVIAALRSGLAERLAVRELGSRPRVVVSDMVDLAGVSAYFGGAEGSWGLGGGVKGRKARVSRTFEFGRFPQSLYSKGAKSARNRGTPRYGC